MRDPEERIQRMMDKLGCFWTSPHRAVVRGTTPSTPGVAQRRYYHCPRTGRVHALGRPCLCCGDTEEVSRLRLRVESLERDEATRRAWAGVDGDEMPPGFSTY